MTDMTVKNPIQTENGNRVYFSPRVDVIESDDELVFYADVPGVKSENADIQFQNGELTIHCRCERPQPQAYAQQGYAVGDYYRAFTISEAIDAGKISAELKHGVLTVRLPKAEQVKPRKIAVKSE